MFPLPTEVQQRPVGLRDVLVEPGQEVELGDGSRLVGLHVLQVEAPHQEVIAPDVFRHQVHLQGVRKQPSPDAFHAGENPSRGSTCSSGEARFHLPRRCGRGWIPRQASSGSTASRRSPPGASASQSPRSRSPRPSAGARDRGKSLQPHWITACGFPGADVCRRRDEVTSATDFTPITQNSKDVNHETKWPATASLNISLCIFLFATK